MYHFLQLKTSYLFADVIFTVFNIHCKTEVKVTLSLSTAPQYIS